MTDEPSGASDEGRRTDRLELRLCGLRVSVESEDAEFLAGLRRCFDLRSGRDGGVSDLLVKVAADDGQTHGLRTFTTAPDQVLSELGFGSPAAPTTLASGLGQWAVSHSRLCYAFHAGAVTHEGRAVLLPGESGRGKSTLTAALVRAGFCFLSDEVGVIDLSSGRIVSYPRVLSLRPPSLELLGLPASAGYGDAGTSSRFVHPSELGGVRDERGAPLAVVVLPEYREGAAPSLERLGLGAAVVALMSASCSQRLFKVAGFDRVVELARRVPCYRATYSDADSGVGLVEEAMNALPPERP